MSRKNLLKKVELRKRSVLGFASLACAGVLLASVAFNATRAAFDVKATNAGAMKVGNFEITVTPFNEAANEAATSISGFTVSSDMLDTAKAKNTTENDGKTAKFNTFADFKTWPGKSVAYGFKVSNTGNVPVMNLSLELKSTYKGTDGDPNFKKDPSSRINYTVYQSKTGDNFVANGTGTLADVTAEKKVTNDYVTFDKLPGDETADGTVYYVIVFEFTDETNEWTGNFTDDNSFKNAGVGFDLNIRAQQPAPVSQTTGQTGE